MKFGHLLTRSGLTYPEVSSKICHDYFCQLEKSVSLPWVIYYKAFYLHVVSSFSCTPVISPKLVLFLISLYMCVFIRYTLTYTHIFSRVVATLLQSLHFILNRNHIRRHKGNTELSIDVLPAPPSTRLT